VARGVAEWANLSAQALALGLVCVTPWLFAGAQAGVQRWLVVVVACGLLLSLAYVLLGGATRATALLAALPLLAGLGLVALQLLPLDRSVHQWLSPQGVALRDALESRAPSADASLAEHFGVPAIPDRHPLSLYPAATRRELALLSMAVGMFLIGIVCFSSRCAQQRLGILIAANAALLVFLGLIQALTWNEKIYWQVSLTEGGGPFGPFVNRNNAGGYLNMCLAGALGWTIFAFARDRAVSASPTARSQVNGFSRLLSRWLRGLHAFFARLKGVKLASLLITAWIVTGVLATLSRGAWVAMVGAALVTALVVLARRWRVLWVSLTAVVCAGAVGITIWSGMGKRVTDRLGTLLDESILTHGLLGLWRDSLQAVPDFWRTGTGFGTFRYVYGPYYRQPTENWFHYAENQYVQAAIETGLLGPALMLVMIGLVGLACWRIIRRDASARASALAIGGLFALAAQAIHACFDFGLSIPANMLLSFLLCGALVGRASALPGQHSASQPKVGIPSRLLAASAIVVVACANVWASSELNRSAAVDSAVQSARFKDAGFNLSEQDLSAAIERLSAAVDGREDDAEGHQHLARLWTHLYRIRALQDLVKPDGSGGDPKALWPLTLPVVLHRQIHQAAPDDPGRGVEQLRNVPAVRECLFPAMAEFVQARRHCPLLPYAHLGIAELSGLFVGPDEDRLPLERARRLAPADLRILFESGVADLNAGRREVACESFRQGLALGTRYLSEILAVSEERLSLLEVAERVLPDSPQLLLDFAARKQYQSARYTAVRHRLAQRALDAIDQCDLTDDEKCHLRASALVLQQRYDEAIGEGQRAVLMQPRRLSWRYELALLLKTQGSLEKAHEHARVCAMLNPSKREYRQLLTL
jgi:O-antigen ligase